jgi:hypothetical protein
MKINPQIKTVLSTYGISEPDGLAYLLAIFYDCRPSYTPTLLVQRMNITNILGISPDKEIMWNIPLFEGAAEEKWDWVKEWNDQFKHINPKRKGPHTSCITRMKAFFADNPDVRKVEVIEATKMYFRSLSNAEYLTSSHYFISKGIGRDRVSALENWVEKYKETMESLPVSESGDITSRMQ